MIHDPILQNKTAFIIFPRIRGVHNEIVNRGPHRKIVKYKSAAVWRQWTYGRHFCGSLQSRVLYATKGHVFGKYPQFCGSYDELVI